ncbi:MAG TPA: protein kinase [Paludibaculum sp.]|jgi:serine/threonine protein kinase/tetratricopeptide (TPR) repeat protein
MTAECPICHTSNPPGTAVCIRCSTPFDSDERTLIGDSATIVPDEKTIVDTGGSASGAGAEWTRTIDAAESAQARAPIGPGSVLASRYEIQAVLGEGGMGAVYRARDRELDRLVALKVIRAEFANHGEILRRFKQELILARQVTHKNVVRIFDLGVTDGLKFITMEYVDGRDLKSMLVKGGKMAPATAVKIIRQVLLGLQAAHNEGVVHRDLKPQNIMVDAQDRVYLMDFGIARSMEAAGMTRTGALMGTPDYMSPEQAMGEKVDARSDLFSVGVILYEMLTGTQPYESLTVMGTLIKRTKEKATPVRELDPTLPQFLSDIVSRCLEISLERRYQDASEIVQDLDSSTASTSGSARLAQLQSGGGASGPRGLLTPGSDFGPRYRIEALLGEGGMGKVYKAFDRDLDRTVALKLVRPELAADPVSMDRLKQELLLASRVSQKSILRIHDLGDVGGTKFISMAFVDGEDLHQLISREGKLELERALTISKQLCRALDAAHAEEVVHRDLKPQNVLIDAAGTAYVSDFGLAKSLEAGAALVTRAGEIMGTPRYMSPEQAESKPVDHRTDLYALGLIIYEMVTGDLPFRSDTVLQAMYQRVTQAPKNPKLLNPDLPDEIVSVIMRCLEKEPDARYQHARDILADLESGRAAKPAAAPEPVAAPPPPAASGGKGKWWAAGAVAAALVASLAVPQVRHAFSGASAATPSSGAAQAKYVAVLPFRAIGDAAEVGSAADGIVETLSARLIQLKEIHLSSPTAAAKADLKLPLERIARSLGAKLVVQGTVQGAGNKLQVVVSVDDPASGKRVWTQEFSGLKEDLLTIEDDIYNKLIAGLNLKLSNEETARGATRLTEDIGAYDLYLKGRNLLRGQRDEKTLRAALEFFDSASKKDPGFALAYTGVTDASLYMYDLQKDPVWTVRALGAANRAQTLNDNLPEVHISLGKTYRKTGKSAQAIAELKRALELAPNSDEGYRGLGRAYLDAGRKDEGLAAMNKAVEANPYYWSNHNELGIAYLQVGKNAEALAALKKVTELEPSRPAGWINLGTTYYRMGRWDDSIPAFQTALQLQPTANGYGNLGAAYLYAGKFNDARVNFERAVELNPKSHVDLGNLADALRFLGQKDKAGAVYDRAIAEGFKTLQVNPRDPKALSELGLFYAKKGDPAKAQDFLRRARAIDKNDVDLMYKLVVADALAGHGEDAVKGLKEAVAKGYPAREAANDPDLKSLQARADFQQIIKQSGGGAK